MSLTRHTGLVAIVLSITMVCAVLVTSLVPSDKLQITYICCEENGDNPSITKAQSNASLIPKPIKEASFEDAVSAIGWIKSEKITALQNNSAFYAAVGYTVVPVPVLRGCHNYTKLLCRLLI